MEQFEVLSWVAIYRRYESAGTYASIDEALDAGLAKFESNGAMFDVFHNNKKVARVTFHWGKHTTTTRMHWVPTVTRF